MFLVFSLKLENLPAPHGNCEEKTLQYIDTYTSESCRLDCLTKRAQTMCGCRALYMPHKNGSPHLFIQTILVISASGNNLFSLKALSFSITCL